MHKGRQSVDILKILKDNDIVNFKVEEKSKGFDHYIYIVYTEKENYCVRIPVKEKNKIVAQAWACREWKRLGVPVPEIFAVDEDYLIEELIEGKDLDESELAHSKMEEIVFELGNHASIMHTVDTRGFGYLEKAGRGSKKTWREFIEPDFKGTLADNFGHKLLSDGQFQTAKSVFDENGRYLELKNPKLVHADMKKDNILIHNKKLAGIIDASDSLSGDVYYDLAVIRYAFGEELFKYFLRGYGNIDETRLNFYLLYYTNWLIAFYGHINKDEKELGKAKEMFEKSVSGLQDSAKNR